MSDNKPDTPNSNGSPPGSKVGGNELIPRPMGPLQMPLGTEGNTSKGRLTVSWIPDPAGLLRSFMRRWLVAIVLATVVAGIVGPVTWFLCQRFEQPRYTATAIVRMAPSKPVIAFNVPDPYESRYYQTQLVLISSKYVISAALRRPGISQLKTVREQSDAISWLARSISVSWLGGSDLLRISLTGTSSEDLIPLVNAVKDAYLNEVVDADKNVQLARIEHLEKVKAGREEMFRAKRAGLEALARTLGGSKSETLILRESTELQVYTEILRERTRLQFDLIKAEGELALSKKKAEVASEQDIPEELIERVMASDPNLGALRNQLARAENTVAQYEKVLKPNTSSRALVEAQRNVEKTRDLLAERETEMRPMVVEQVEKLRGANVAQIEQRIENMKEQDQLLEKQLNYHRQEARSIGTQSLEVEFLREEIDQIQNVNNVIATQIEQLRVETLAPSRVTDYEKADAFNTYRNDDRVWRLTGIATTGSFALIVLLICWWDFSTHRVDRPNDVEERLGLRVIGAIPALPSRMRRSLPAADSNESQNWFHFLTESIDCVRAQLLHEARISGTRVIMVASAVGREGKTTLSCHLAASLARAGRRTLFLDGDMRRPTAHRLLDQSLTPGLAELLRGEISWRDAARATSLQCLTMIPAGEIDSAAVQELSKDSIASLFEDFRREFDFVIVDSAPVLAVSDALSLGRHTDGVIFSLMHEATQLASLNEAHERVMRLGLRILGAVVNGARGFTYGYNYYRNRYERYGYGYTYGGSGYTYGGSIRNGNGDGNAKDDALVGEENPA
jgi:polysaccharide biosynthesis transport protein